MIRFVLDLYGGDAPMDRLLPGAMEALKREKDICLTLVGPEKDLRAALAQYDFDPSAVAIAPASQVLTNRQNPMLAVKGEEDYTITAAFLAARDSKEPACLISVGNTGAVMLSSVVRLGMAPHCTKPVLASLLPCRKKRYVCLLDCGANLEATAEELLHFACLGSECAGRAMNEASPRVALVNVGQEEGKGTALLKDAYALLKDSELNFVGNAEPDMLFSGDIDVAVCSGLVGNILLKNTEAVGLGAVARMEQAVSALPDNEARRMLTEVLEGQKHAYGFNRYGGAILLGVRGTVIKAHGKAEAETIASCIHQGYALCANSGRYEENRY